MSTLLRCPHMYRRHGLWSATSNSAEMNTVLHNITCVYSATHVAECTVLQDSYMGGLCALMNLHWSREASETCYNQMALCLDKTCHAMAQTATFKHNKHNSKWLLQMGDVMSHDIANHMPEHTFNPQISLTRPAPKSCDKDIMCTQSCIQTCRICMSYITLL